MDANYPGLGNATYQSRERWADRGYGLKRFTAFLMSRHDFQVPLELCGVEAMPPVLSPSAAALLNVGRLPMLAASIAAFVEWER